MASSFLRTEDRTKARADCFEAVAFVKSSVVNLMRKAEYLQQLARFFKKIGDTTEAKEVLQELYCTICDEKGPADPLLQAVVNDLGNILKSTGDVDGAEHFYRTTTIENLKKHCQQTNYSVVDLFSASVELGDILLDRAMKTPEVASAAGPLQGESTKGAYLAEAESLFKEAISLREFDPVKMRTGYVIALMKLNSLYLDQERVDEEVEKSMKLAFQLQKEYKLPSRSIAEAAFRLFQYYILKLVDHAPILSEGCPAPRSYKEDLLDARSLLLETLEILVVDSDETIEGGTYAEVFRLSMMQMGDRFLLTFAY
jgi:tetratricopeptide (TPR) repeat protein